MGEAEQISEEAVVLARRLAGEMDVKHGEIAIRVKDGKPVGIRKINDWVEGKSGIKRRG